MLGQQLSNTLLDSYHSGVGHPVFHASQNGHCFIGFTKGIITFLSSQGLGVFEDRGVDVRPSIMKVYGKKKNKGKKGILIPKSRERTSQAWERFGLLPCSGVRWLLGYL